ncbi:DUF1659 domain-containing protein [Gudongella sp. DL1XJH-153]|uniref:DUF1659 domain-containing protein n=1 Tax=Gudongella sp. DL1XJH-153 TaxID=3409804 RepID=UPI003BB70D3B
MAIEVMAEKKTLKLELDAGIVDGRQRISSKSYSNVKLDATDDNIHVSGETLAGLQNLPLMKVKKVEESVITNV